MHLAVSISPQQVTQKKGCGNPWVWGDCWGGVKFLGVGTLGWVIKGWGLTGGRNFNSHICDGRNR